LSSEPVIGSHLNIPLRYLRVESSPAFWSEEIRFLLTTSPQTAHQK
jgi:hypothetical protein